MANGIAQMLITGNSFHGPKKISFTPELVDTVIANFKKRGDAQLPIWLGSHDVTDAAGFITALEKVRDGDDLRLMATVDWNDVGSEKIKKDHLRYISPEIAFNVISKDTGEDQGPTLMGAALLNDPHIEKQPRVIVLSNAKAENVIQFDGITVEIEPGDNVEQKREGEFSMKTELLKVLSAAGIELAADADDNQIMEAINTLAAGKAAAIDAKADAESKLAKLSTKVEELSTKHGETVSLAVHNELVSKVELLEAEKRRNEAEKAVDAVIGEGRAYPAQRDIMIDTHLSNAAHAEKLFATFKKVIDLNSATGENGTIEPIDDDPELVALKAYQEKKAAGGTPQECAEAAFAAKSQI